MNRYPEKIQIDLAPGVQTVSEVLDDTVPIVNDGFKNYDIIFMIDKLFLVDNCQALVEPNTSNTAITVKVKTAELDRFIGMLQATRLSGQNAISQIRSLIENRKSVSPEKDWVTFERKDVAAIAILRGQLEKVLININLNAVMSRMMFLPVAGSEFVSQGDRLYFQSIVDLLNSDGTKNGTKLIKDTIKYTPGEIGVNTLGTLVKSADISLESKSVLRQVMQNQSKDVVYNTAINGIDAFCAPELAVLPLNNNQLLLKLTQIRYVNQGLTTYSEDLQTLDMDLPFLGQDWYTAYSAANPTNNKPDPKPSISKVLDDVDLKGMQRILTQMWLANVDNSLAGQEAAGYLLNFGYELASHNLHKLFPVQTLIDGKVKIDLFSNLVNLVKQSPFVSVQKWTSNQVMGGAPGSMTDIFILFLKALILNFLPNLVRLGQYQLTKESIATETIRTVLGDYSADYMEWVDEMIKDKNVSASVVLTSKVSIRG